MNKLLLFGVFVTTLYAIFLTYLLVENWGEFSSLDPNEWGDFLAGSLGPVAVFWLILGYFQQGRELQHSVEALNLQAAELKNAVGQQKTMVGVTRRQLEIEEAAFKENSWMRQEAEMPHLVVSRHRHGTNYGHPFYEYKITNIGKSAVRISLSISPTLEKVYPLEFRAVPSNGEVTFEVVFDNETEQVDFQQTHELTLISENQMGRTKIQSYDLKGTEVVQTRTTVETVAW